MNAKKRLAAGAYKKYKKGDSLSDEEVRAGAQVFPELATVLRALGPEFHHAAVDLTLVGNEFENFKDARRKK